ncbi:Glu-tRNA(Gln) amidotransferase subunit GatE [Candidatus Woesearchaeota archaeon]|nr:Glu-tRNA(Gln) amidotransferase subunit GatE [Candidatus Woesearchaeota archaeon]
MAFDSSLGLKVGLEIHQQLETVKLFCPCPSLLRDDAPHYLVHRQLRAVAGESGAVDVAAQAEHLRGREFIYEAYHDTTCLVELDEEPPHPLNQDALAIALQVAKLVNATIATEIQVMRKTIVNGSVVSGFQRTALVGMDGHIKGPFGTITIPTILLEEDAAKDIAQTQDSVTYRLDRLGIPLIEISTGPDITDPVQCIDVAMYLGMLLRSTEKVKRGLGTIRQDLNVSIAGGQRVEIKGAQDLKMLPTIVEYEAQRQKSLLDLAASVKTVTMGKVTAVTSVFANAASKVIADALSRGGVVLGLRLAQMHGLLGKEVQPCRRVGTELSDYAKFYGGVGGIFHSDELPKYGITAEDVQRLRAALGCAEQDAFVLIADTATKAAKGMEGVMARVHMIAHGVPREVRRANPDGTSTYMRPMPGAARLYPETDVRPVAPSQTMTLPELWTTKVDRIIIHGIGKDLAQALVSDGYADLFFACVKKYQQVKPAFMAETIVSVPKILLRKYNLQVYPTPEEYHAVFAALSRGNVTKDALLDIFRSEGPIDQRILRYKVLGEKELEAKIRELLAAWKDVPPQVLRGKVVDALKTRADAQKVLQLLAKFLRL